MTKRYMTSLADTQHIFTDLWGIEFWIWLSPRAVSRLCARFARVRARRDYKVATLGINLSLILYTTRIQKQFPLPFSSFLLSFLLHKTRARVAMRFPAKITSSSSCHTGRLSYFTLVCLWCGRTGRRADVRSHGYQRFSEAQSKMW